MTEQVNAIVISASSDIAGAICKDWLKKGWRVFGTFRKSSKLVKELEKHPNMTTVFCDLLDLSSVEQACRTLKKLCPKWDALMIAPCRQEPLGAFNTLNYDEWEEGIQVNLLRQMRMLHFLLPYRNLQSTLPFPSVLFFAGGGTNNAVLYYSSYTLSKIAMIKMVELLDAELPDTRFVIVGPGYVKTKGHLPTLQSNPKVVGDHYQKTIDYLKSNRCTPMHEVVNCCNWVLTTKCKSVNGRNFSVVFDKWGTKQLEKALDEDVNMYKLRRGKNDWKPPSDESSQVNDYSATC